MEKLHSKMVTSMQGSFIMVCYMVQLLKYISLGKGKFTWANGVIYEGDFTYNKIEGDGTYLWPDGSKYVGTVINGLRHGFGKF